MQKDFSEHSNSHISEQTTYLSEFLQLVKAHLSDQYLEQEPRELYRKTVTSMTYTLSEWLEPKCKFIDSLKIIQLLI